MFHNKYRLQGNSICVIYEFFKRNTFTTLDCKREEGKLINIMNKVQFFHGLDNCFTKFVKITFIKIIINLLIVMV